MNAKDNLQKHFESVLTRWKEQRDPYAWRLGLSLKFYTEGIELLEKVLNEEGNSDFLYGKAFAPIALILVAEWYKREYTGNNADNPEWVKQTEWKNVWMASGIKRWERWVYRFEESGNFSWQYSAYVLGGMACRFISEQDKDSRLLKDLCRLFHGQIDESAIDASGSARALSMSIEKGGSVYHFLMDLMDHTSPLSIAYSQDQQEEVSNLRKKIMEANKEVTRRKLRTEWRFTTSPYNPENLHRSLRISLAPERVEGEKRWFLSRERAREWGLDLTDGLSDINVMLTLYRKGEPIEEPIRVMNFQPTGSLKAGFNIMDENPWYILSNLPSDFDGWRLSAETNDGQQVDIDPTINPVGDWTQIYRTAKNAHVWSSSRRRMTSAVVFNDKCRITDPDGHPIAGKMLLVDNCPTRHINWADIPVYVKLAYPAKGGGEREEKLVSPLAGCQLRAERIFPNLIDYLPGGNISVRHTDPQTGEEEEEKMQLAYGLNDIYLAWLENGKDPKTAKAEAITAKQKGTETNLDELKKGVTELTAYANGLQATAKVWYIPDDGKPAPGRRDLKKQRVVWGKKTVPTSSIETGEELQPTVEVKDRDTFGNEAVINVYQPVERTEIWVGDRLADILPTDSTAYISLLHLPKVTIRRFDKDGYRSWVGAEHLNEFKGLRLPSTDTRKTEIPNVCVINFKEDEPSRENQVEIGAYLLEKGTGQIKWKAPAYCKLKSDDYDDPFGDSDPFGDTDNGAVSLDSVDTLEAAIEHNLYTFYFDELFNKGRQIAEWMDDVRKRRGDEFMRENKDSVRRILWENDITTKDLNFSI